MSKREIYAAVDLGSNSFHMVVARQDHGQLRVIDQIKEMVRLAGGLDRHGNLAAETRHRALDCLARFGQRITGIPQENVRAVGTQTLRRLRAPQTFLVIAETALGCPIDIISGQEEARLVYQGVSEGVADNQRRRLVIDIGGGSTELVIGSGTAADLEMVESLPYGCVVVSQEFFGADRITRRQWQRARDTLLSALQALATRYLHSGWDVTIGSSGTNRNILSVCAAMGWCEDTITLDALRRLRDHLIEYGQVSGLDLPTLSDTRAPVFAGGVVILEACFQALGLQNMQVSPFALREGLLYNLLGRLQHTDPRDHSIRALAARYSVDTAQADRVHDFAVAAFEQVAESWSLNRVHRELLAWACRVHEIGLAVSHDSYPAHSAYLLEHSDLPGFTRQEQQFMAVLAGGHRGKPDPALINHLPERLRNPCRSLLALLRLATVFCRARDSRAIPEFGLIADPDRLRLLLPAGWMDANPLTSNGLDREKSQWLRIGLKLEVSKLPATVRASPSRS